jgi:hypothetical protein
MSNIFDSLKIKTFDVITKTMGYDAVWISSELGSFPSLARVVYKDPSEKQELSGIDSWNPDQPFMEYRIGFFLRLKERVDLGFAEFVEINGKGFFAVREVKTKFDGDTFMARLEFDNR